MIEDAIDIAVSHRITMDSCEKVMKDIMEEMDRAVRKFPTWPTDVLHAKAILGEEYGELNKAILETVYEFPKSTQDDVRKEAIQTAAMAIRFLVSLDKYTYIPSKQHKQGSQYD